MAGASAREMRDYMLSDYQFLEDYEVIESNACNKGSFVACIKNTDQKVRFIKRRYRQQQLARFKALHQLYKSGIILADNMFILEECEEPYFYIIEAELDPDNSRFTTLHHYLYYQDITTQQRKAILAKIKILIDCLHQEGQPFAGLDPRKIILDDQGHLYLAPFDLDFELTMDSYSRAYYSPEVLVAISNNQHSISESMMFKWDIWSFGCICLELLVFSSPVFLASSLSRQLRLIQKSDVLAGLSNFQDSVKNIMNSRTISTSSINPTTPLETQPSETTSREAASSLTRSLQQVSLMRELNIDQNSKGECTLVINFLALSNITFDKELRVSIHINKVFHFYVDFDQKQRKKYTLNRKITMHGSFLQIEKLLSKPIMVELREDEKSSKININLQTIALSHYGQRIWNQPIISSYSANPCTPFPSARLKLSCFLNIEQTSNSSKTDNTNSISSAIGNPSSIPIEQKTAESNILKERSSNQMQVKTERFSGQLRVGLDNSNALNEQKGFNRQNKQKIPSISEISSRIGAIAEELKRKIIPEGLTGEDQIQKQLSSLLDLH